MESIRSPLIGTVRGGVGIVSAICLVIGASKSECKELLITDNIGLLAVKSAAAMVAWPIMVMISLICDD